MEQVPPAPAPPTEPLPPLPPIVKPVSRSGWSAGAPLTPDESWASLGQGSWELVDVDLAVQDGRALVSALVSQYEYVGRDEHGQPIERNDEFIETWVSDDGEGWRSLGGASVGGMSAFTVQGVAWTPEGAPLRARRVAEGRVQVERWEGAAWTAVGAPLGERYAPGCFAMFAHGQGLVVVWKEEDNVSWMQTFGRLHAGRLDLSSGHFTALGTPRAPAEGQSLVGCESVQLDAAGQPVVAWTEEAYDSRQNEAKVELRVARWDDAAAAWQDLPSAEEGPRRQWNPRLTLSPQGALVVVWLASTPYGEEPYRAAWEQRRYDAAKEAWEDVGPPLSGFVTAVQHTERGELVLCEGLVCSTLQEGAWRALGTDAPSGPSVSNALARDASGTLYLLGREGPQYGGTWEPQEEKPRLRLHRYVP